MQRRRPPWCTRMCTRSSIVIKSRTYKRRPPPRVGFWHAYLRTSSTAVHQNRIFFTAGLHSRIFYFKKFDWTAPPHKFHSAALHVFQHRSFYPAYIYHSTCKYGSYLPLHVFMRRRHAAARYKVRLQNWRTEKLWRHHAATPPNSGGNLPSHLSECNCTVPLDSFLRRQSATAFSSVQLHCATERCFYRCTAAMP